MLGSDAEVAKNLLAIKSPLVIKAIGKQSIERALYVLQKDSPTLSELESIRTLLQKALRRVGDPGPFLLYKRRVFDVFTRYVRIQTLASREVDEALFFLIKNLSLSIDRQKARRVVYKSGPFERPTC